MEVGRGAKTLPFKKKIFEKPPRNSAGFCGEGQGRSWAVEPRKEERKNEIINLFFVKIFIFMLHFIISTDLC
jgi:hypothetical protein